jgi:hypothetical protein
MQVLPPQPELGGGEWGEVICLLDPSQHPNSPIQSPGNFNLKLKPISIPASCSIHFPLHPCTVSLILKIIPTCTQLCPLPYTQYLLFLTTNITPS